MLYKGKQTEYQPNRVKCWNTPHGSNPTLMQAVNGLRNIIQFPRVPVLRTLSSPADVIVGQGCSDSSAFCGASL